MRGGCSPKEAFTMKKHITIAVALCLFASMLALGGCGSNDHSQLQGEWQVEGTEVTVVFTEDELKMVGETFGYTIDTDEQVINYTSNDEDYGQAAYAFSDDGQTLTLEESDGSGGTTTTTFVKLSDDTTAEPVASASSDDEDASEDEEGESDESGSEEEEGESTEEDGSAEE